MTYEEIKEFIDFKADCIRKNREKCGYSKRDADMAVRHYVCGMVKAYESMNCLTQNQAIEIVIDY